MPGGALKSWSGARLRKVLLFAALCAGLFPLPSLAQDRASLIADRLQISGEDNLIASGTVEIFYKGRKLRASGLVYNGTTDRLMISGPIVLTEETGALVILASQAEMAADLSQGVLESARMVLNSQLQLAANRLSRLDGRYSELDQAVASSCKVCAGSLTPLWEIRARRIVHDAQERQIYFDHAQLRVYGVPVFYVPRLRMPDPTLSRASGFLKPSLRTTTGLGTGIKLPYFLTLGPNRDITLTPYLSRKNGRTLELRYRQAFSSGTLNATGAISRDQLQPGDTRGYLKIDGQFSLPRDFTLQLKGTVVTDPAYLLDYGISDEDRLDSRLIVQRTRRNEHISARLINFRSLRDDEDNQTIPGIVTDASYHRRFSVGVIGGEGGLRLEAKGLTRRSLSPLDGPDLDTIADGRDVGRLSIGVEWRRSVILPLGLEGTILGEVTADSYEVRQDAVFGGTQTSVYAAGGVELRWPLVASNGQGGATHVLEPVVQLIWAPRQLNARLAEDSTLVEFDEGNLFALNRYPGSDSVETGARANIGIGWTRIAASGWSMGVTVGRVLRATPSSAFSSASGLSGQNSDWLVSGQVALTDGSQLFTRGVFADDFSLTKGEMRLDLTVDRMDVAASFVWVAADPIIENRPDPTREVTLDAAYRFTPNWTGKASGRYDFALQTGTVAGVGMEFRNECMRVDLSLSRRFTSSTTVSPSTDIGLSVELVGFGSGVAAGPARTCRR